MTYHGFDIPVDINSDYIYSFDAYISEDANIASTGTTFISSGEKGFSKTFYYDNTKKGTWQHFEVTKRPSTSTARILLYPTGTSTPSTGYIIYKNVNFNKVGTTVNLFTQPVDNSGFTVRGNGIITKDIAKTYNYRYDGLNRLTSTNEDISLGYSYNADGLRISKTANGNTINYVWDGDQIVLELDGTGVAKNRYVRGINLIYAEDGAGANRKYYLFNGHGDVVQLTNTEGDVVKNYNYDSFGNEISAKKDCKDSFVDGIAYGWENYGGIWKVENGEYSVNISNGAKSLMSGVLGSDYTIEADVKLLGSSGDAGLAFRVLNPSVGGDSFNGYYVGLNIQTGNIVLGKMDGNWSVITQVPFTVNSNVSYHLKVVANGSNIKIYVNGILKINVNDTTYTSGGIGVRAHYSNTHFDNIVVTGATYTDNDQNAFRYCGEYFDKETGTVYLRARYYNPSVGRFITEDSYRGEDSDPLSLNLYTYCHNDPVNYFDPSGHIREGYTDNKGVYHADPDAEEFGKDSVTYNALYILGRHWIDAADKSEEKVISDFANLIRNKSRELIRAGVVITNKLFIVEKVGWNDVEVILYLSDPVQAAKVATTGQMAYSATKEYYGGYHVGGNGDAFRHTFWNALMSRFLGDDVAKLWGDAHEYGLSGNIGKDKRADLYNNRIGRALGSNKNISHFELKSSVLFFWLIMEF